VWKKGEFVMECSNQDCRKPQPETLFGKIKSDAGIIREREWYCDEYCYEHPILKEYILRKQSRREFRASSYPVTAQHFGSQMVSMGKISREQLETASIERYINERLPIPHFLMKEGLINRKDVLEALGIIHRVPVGHLSGRSIPQNLIDLIPAQVARLGNVVPFSYNAATNHLSVLMKDPTDLSTVVTLKKLTNCQIDIFQGDPREIREAVSKYYHSYIELAEQENVEREFAVAN
jgi:hypothetical protein